MIFATFCVKLSKSMYKVILNEPAYDESYLSSQSKRINREKLIAWAKGTYNQLFLE